MPMVTEKEIRIALNTPMSGIDMPIASHAIAFPNPLVHKRILDIGAFFRCYSLSFEAKSGCIRVRPKIC